jgi:hypothetical protein
MPSPKPKKTQRCGLLNSQLINRSDMSYGRRVRLIAQYTSFNLDLKTYFFFEMMTYLKEHMSYPPKLVTPIIFLFCIADTTFALKRSEESGA